MHVLAADTPEEFTHSVVAVLRDAGMAANLGRAAGEFIRERYTWDRTLAPLDELLEELVPSTHVAGSIA